jgi:hypothetical protein
MEDRSAIYHMAVLTLRNAEEGNIPQGIVSMRRGLAPGGGSFHVRPSTSSPVRPPRMSRPDITTEWQPMTTAPKDGSRILVTVRASEQGPAEVDVVKWARPEAAAEPGWVATDSDADAPIVYAAGELASWMPLPSALPSLRSVRIAAGEPPPPYSGEMDGSAI